MLFYCWSTPGNPNIRQTGLVSLPLSVRFPPLFLAPPPPTPPPPFPSSWPHTSHTVNESPQLSTHSPHSSICPKPFRSECLAARSCLSSMQPVSQVSQPVCTQSWPHMKASISEPCGTRCSSSVSQTEASTQPSGRLLLPLPSCPSKGITKCTPNMCSSFEQPPAKIL